MSIQDPESDHDPGIDADAAKYHTEQGAGVLYSYDQNKVVTETAVEDDTTLDIFAHGHGGEVANWALTISPMKLFD